MNPICTQYAEHKKYRGSKKQKNYKFSGIRQKKNDKKQEPFIWILHRMGTKEGL